jgi:hypothetical protein
VHESRSVSRGDRALRVLRPSASVDPRATQNWEALAADPPPEWYRFSRSGGLAARIRELDTTIDAEIAATTKRIERLYHELPVALNALLDSSREEADDTFWRPFLKTLATSCRETARRIAGNKHPEIIAVHEERPTPFRSVAQALAFFVTMQSRALGVGSISYVIALDTEQTRRERARDAARGQTLGKDERGYLSVEYMPAKQSRSGATPGARNEDDKLLAADVQAAIGHAKISPLDLEALIASDVGVYRGPARRARHGRIIEAYSPAGSAELAESFEARGEPAMSPHAAGKRVARARRALHEELALRGLCPKPVRRHPGAEPVPTHDEEAPGGAAFEGPESVGLAA